MTQPAGAVVGEADLDGGGEDLALLRSVLARELETINEYERYARLAKRGTLRAFFSHLALEEKEHVAEAMALIQQLDAGQREKSAVVDVGLAHFDGSRAKGTLAAIEPVPRAAHRLTVGSLRAR